MKKMTVVLLLLLTACGTVVPTVKIAHPEIDLQQSSSVPAGARHVTGGMPVSYVLRVHNVANEPIRLDRVDLQSVGEGAYTVQPISLPVGRDIPAGASDSFPLVSAATAHSTISGANGPVTMRAMLFFSTKDGKFQEVVIRNVSARY